MLADGFEIKHPPEEMLSCLAYEDSVGRSERLKSRREIGSFADDSALLRGAGSDDFADHAETRGDADSRLKPRPVRARDAADFRQDTDRGANGAFGRILEGARKAKISQNAIPHDSGDEAAEPPNRTHSGVLIAPDQRAQRLGIDRTR